MMLQVVLLLACLSGAIGSTSACCPPSRFNAFQYVTIVNSTTRIRGLYYMVYDGPNERYLLTGDRLNNLYDTTKVIYDYKKGIAYNIDVQKRSCTTYPLHGKFEDQESVCVPRDAVYTGRSAYGYDQGALDSWSYEYNRTHPDGRHQNIETTVTKEDCIPIITTTISTDAAGGNSLHILGYNDFYPGIRDISMLEIPSYCRA
ncbi:ependymin-related protein 2-like [Haliotis asinina]|uniref:ependymin-related protein 2-like n=1 Tax=Haliotis asinina TaxID=109174 RepID=UPI0035324022